MSMKDLAMYHAMALMYQATYGKYVAPYTEPIPTSLRLKDEPVKLTGFTQITGRRRLSKKQRKQQRKQQLKNRKKMTDKEIIIDKIKQLKDLFKTEREKTSTTDKGMVDKLSFSSKIVVLEELLAFINLLPAEPSEEVEAEIDRYFKDDKWFSTPLGDIARHFANWQKEQTIKKACEWLNKNVVEYHPRKGELRPIVNTNAFREAMEKEDEQ